MVITVFQILADSLWISRASASLSGLGEGKMMKAVIMAAGEGSRMQKTLAGEPSPKPLLPLLGLRIAVEGLKQ